MKGGGYASLGSLAVHLSMLIALWVCNRSLISDSEQYVEGMIKPGNMLVFLSVVHILAACS